MACGASGMNGVRCGGCSMQKSLCGALWWLSYINCFFCLCGAVRVGRVGVVIHLPASPAQFNQLKHWLNVIYEKMRDNRIFAENRFFFVKKVHQKNLVPICFLPDGTFHGLTSRLKLAEIHFSIMVAAE